MIDFLFAIIALSVLIIVHEFGHYITARLFQVKVLEFSLGFGKKLLQYQGGETQYAISAVPLGGYVKLLGESPDEKVEEEEQHRSFSHKPPFKRFLIVFAGPFFNLLFASLISYCFLISGHTVGTKVGIVEKGYPAYEAGVRSGDVIVRVEGKRIFEWSDLRWEIAFADPGPLHFTFRRDGKDFSVVITPQEVEAKDALGNARKMRIVGLGASEELKENVLSAIPMAMYETYNVVEKTVIGLYRMIVGRIPAKEIGGPITILQLGTKLAEGGLWSLASFAALISISLGVINLLPIPVLDGGHILFNLIEIITGKRASEKTIEIAQKIGLTIIILLMAFALFNDIQRLGGAGGLLEKARYFISALVSKFRILSSKFSP
ncbi:MAG TPA: RIP metalloprotease RseP [Syntrophorhabdaceae bacterium]|nr:RIP metalloprotease RseP [Syntrophorhabdaceae bacterium]